MKIVQVNATYGYGSTGHIAEDIHKFLIENGHESYVFWATKCANDGLKDPNVIRIGNDIDHKLHALMWRILHNQGWNSRICTKVFCKKLAKLNPDLVHLHNLHSNYIHLPTLLKFLSKKKIRVALTLHDCWFFTGHCMHFMEHNNCSKWINGECKKCSAFSKASLQKKVADFYSIKKSLIQNIDILGVIGVSDWISGCGKESLLKNAKLHKRIYNGQDLKLFSPQGDKNTVREKYGVPENKKIILGVSQGWAENKGIIEFQMLAEELCDSAVVVLVGQPNGYKSTDNLKLIGYTSSQQELAELYSVADVFVNPSKMETFGKVTAEALACGTPVVAYNNTGTAEIVEKTVGELVENENKQEMLQAVKRVLSKDKSIYSEKCVESAARFSQQKFLDEHMDFYKELIKI